MTDVLARARRVVTEAHRPDAPKFHPRDDSGPDRLAAPAWAPDDARVPAVPDSPLPGRRTMLAVIALTTLPGLLFAPAFGAGVPGAVLAPISAMAVAAYGTYEATRVMPVLRPWRSMLTAVLGVLLIVETTLFATTAHGLPTERSVAALYHGVRRSWLLTLQSTTPARPDATHMAFVPMLVLLALLVALAVVHHSAAVLTAIVPGLVVAALAQSFYALSVRTAALAVAAYALTIIGLLLPASALRNGRVLACAALVVPTALIGALAMVALDPAQRDPWSARDHVTPPGVSVAAISPLDEIASRLHNPQQALFTVRGVNTDRWQQVVLDRFDGVNWTSSGRLRFLGGDLGAPPGVTVPVVTHSAQVHVDALSGPWLPSQSGLQRVSGVDPLVDDQDGTLLSTSTNTASHYELRWTTPQLGTAALVGAQLQPHAAQPATTVGQVPAGVSKLARIAVGPGSPTFGSALQLERYFREHYRVATGPDLPSGHGWPQIVHFLGVSGGPDAGSPDGVRRGTSEQFAAAYVAVARTAGIPARLVVGFGQPDERGADGSYVIHNVDVLAWPEVAVRGVGWVPMDPMGEHTSRPASGAVSGLALDRATARARAKLPPSSRPSRAPQDKKAPAVPHAAHPVSGTSDLAVLVTIGEILLLVLGVGVLGIPAAKAARGFARRRRIGDAGVVSAWLETRDRLRDHGVHVHRAMTMREVARASRSVIDSPERCAVEQLGDLVDARLWSGTTAAGGVGETAWRSAAAVRTGLSRRPLRARLDAWFSIRSLRPPH